MSECEFCGRTTDASVNGVPFCVKPKCIEAAIKKGTAPIKAIQNAIRSATQEAPDE